MYLLTTFIGTIIIPLVASPLVYLLGRVGARDTVLRGRSYVVRGFALLAILAAWAPFIASAQDFLAGRIQRFGVESMWLHVDGISMLVAAISLTLGALVVLFSGPYMAGEVGEEKYYAMLLAMIGLMIGLACASDLFNLWVWFEGMAVSSYLLVAFYREQAASLEAGMKYLVQSATGSVMVLMGIALVMANTGALDMLEIRAALSRGLPNPYAMAAAGALFVIGFGVKVALVPLHTWLPDAHSQAPSGISAMLSGVVIEVGLIAMLRALSLISGFASWGILFMAFGAANILYGNLLALRQSMVKRMLAYSSLSHVGYILLGLGIALHFKSQLGAQGAFFHLFNHTLMKGLAFLSVGALIYGLFLQNDSHASPKIDDLAGAAQKYPWAAISLSVAVLALGGLPPLSGFMSKWQIFVAGFQTRDGGVVALMIFMALNSALSLAYYAPLVNVMYRKSPSAQVMEGKPLPAAITLPLLAMTVAVVVLGLAPQLMDWATIPAAQTLISTFGR